MAVWKRTCITALCCCLIPQHGKVKLVSTANEMLITFKFYYVELYDDIRTFKMIWLLCRALLTLIMS